MANSFNPSAAADSGTQGAQDPTLVSGQDPGSLFGVPISYDSGAVGTPAPGGEGLGTHDVSQPNQYPAKEAISGVALGGSGAPGTQGIPDADVTPPGSQTFMVTDPNYTAGKPGGGSGIQMVGVQDVISGPNDWTAPQSNYPPATPVLPGDFYPVPGGPGNNAGRGRVLRGGFLKGAR